MTGRTYCRQTGTTAVNQGMSHKLQQVANIKHNRLCHTAPVLFNDQADLSDLETSHVTPNVTLF